MSFPSSFTVLTHTAHLPFLPHQQFKLAEVWGKRTLAAAKEKIESRGGVLPGSARQEGSGGVAEPLMGDYEPLVSRGSAVPSSPGEEVNIQL